MLKVQVIWSYVQLSVHLFLDLVVALRLPLKTEMLTPTSAIMGAGLGSDVAMITDGRFSGGSHGFIVGHVVPEAQEGGPIALIKTGDVITVNGATNIISVDLSDEVLKRCGEPTFRQGNSWVYEKGSKRTVIVFKDSGEISSIKRL